MEKGRALVFVERRFFPAAAAVLLAIMASLLWVPGATRGLAAPRRDEAFSAGLKAALADKVFKGSSLGIYVEGWDDGAVLFAKNADGRFIPASLTKLFTTSAALAVLKPDYRFKTRIYGVGTLADGVYDGNLYIKGFGDPTLVDERLWLLAQTLKNEKGIGEVKGKLYTDATFFDRTAYGAGWAPITRRWYHAPVGALSVNFNTYRKGDEYFAIAGDPEIHAGQRIVEVMKESGIKVDQGSEPAGCTPPGAEEITEIVSRSLDRITADLNKISNNFIAEQILKTLGAEVYGEPGTAAKGLAVVETFLTDEVGLKRGAFTLRDGSGLSQLNRCTPRQVVTLLRSMSERFDAGPEFVASLKVTGVSDHEHDPFQDPALKRKLRVKTGHLSGVDNLAGFAETGSGKRVIFCLMVNHYQKGRFSTDRAVARLAKALVE